MPGSVAARPAPYAVASGGAWHVPTLAPLPTVAPLLTVASLPTLAPLPALVRGS
jgi:hypothetical protein